MNKQHQYGLTVHWTGNRGTGTSSYQAYARSHTIQGNNKPVIPGTSDPAFRGDATKYNPEELLLASISACHMLWYLHLCSDAGVVVIAYSDQATGTMMETDNGGGKFTQVILHPLVTVSDPTMIEKANALHQLANQRCFIANSVNFPIEHHSACHSQEGG